MLATRSLHSYKQMQSSTFKHKIQATLCSDGDKIYMPERVYSQFSALYKVKTQLITTITIWHIIFADAQKYFEFSVSQLHPC